MIYQAEPSQSNISTLLKYADQIEKYLADNKIGENSTKDDFDKFQDFCLKIDSSLKPTEV